MTGDGLTIADPTTVNAYARYGTAAVFESTWRYIVTTGLADLTAKFRDAIKPASELGPPRTSQAGPAARSGDSTKSYLTSSVWPSPLGSKSATSEFLTAKTTSLSR
jgi:hypothetical protein